MDESYMRTAEYLAALNMDACISYCRIREIPIEQVVPFLFKEPEYVLNCIQHFSQEGISYNYLFDNGDVWGIYLTSITEERFHNGIYLMLASGNPGNLINFFDACYKLGFPAVSDADYDAIVIMYTECYPSLQYLNDQTYDDRKFPAIVMDAVRMCTTSGSKAARGPRTTLTGRAGYDELNTDKSKSIRPVVREEEAFEFWCNAPVCRVHFSLKIDGVNTKIAFSQDSDKGLELALSRGRATNSIDYTEAIRRMISQKAINDKALMGRVTGEAFVGLGDLEELQRRYPDKDYKSPKSAAMAMLRAVGNFTEDDYKLLSFRAFDYAERKPDVAFRMLDEAGMDVPPYLEFDGEQIPRTSLEEFNVWMNDNVLTPLWNAGEELGIGSDGVVMYLLADINTERKDKYSDSNIAIKYGYWGAVTYLSTVEEIIFEQRRVEASIVLRIAPTVMRDKNTATRVGIGSPDILIGDGVRIGDTIEFERKSEAYNVYLRKVSV